MHKILSNSEKWMNYIWLIYVPFNLITYIPVKSVYDLLWLMLIVLFLIDYALVYEKSEWRRVTIPLELLITGAFAVFETNFFMIIFLGWQVAFILGRYPRKSFTLFITVYYFLIFAGLIKVLLMKSKLDYGTFYGLSFALFSPLLSYSMARSIVKRQQLNQTNRRLEEIIRKSERDRIARDLHDTLGQSFSMITIKAELAKKLLVKKPDQVSVELDDIEQTSRQNLQLVRNIVNNLHQKSLTEVLLEQSKNLSEADLILITNGEDAATKWPTVIQNQFALVLPEAITNIIRHAQAHEVQIVFREFQDKYQIVVHDDGRAKFFVRTGSNGLSGMQSRMAEVGGIFKIKNEGHGTYVTFEIIKGQND